MSSRENNAILIANEEKKKLDENLKEITSNLVLLMGNASAIRPNHKTSIPTFVGFILALLFNQDTIYILIGGMLL